MGVRVNIIIRAWTVLVSDHPNALAAVARPVRTVADKTIVDGRPQYEVDIDGIIYTVLDHSRVIELPSA